jgi:membrane fusion protein, multidrug efflux system
MKQGIIGLIIISIMAIACNDANKTPSNGNGDLDSLRQELKVKQEALKTLSAEIDLLSAQMSEMDTTDKPRRLVTLDTIKTEEFKHYIEFQATVQSDEVVNISSEIGGRIIKLNIKEGQMVQKGQLVARLDSETLQRQLEELETSLALANTVFEKQQKLWDQKIGSEIQYIEAKSNKERLEKSRSTLRSQFAKTSLYAPANGVVEILHLREGESLPPGMALATLVNVKKIKVVASLPESYIGVVRTGDKVGIRFPSLDRELTASISRIGKTISEGNRTFMVEAPIKQIKDDLFKPNSLARMKINDFTQKDAIVLNAELLQQESNGKQFVFVKGGNGHNPVALKQYIEIEKIFEDKILVKSGLQVGDIIIRDGARGLSNNELISF